MNRPVSLHDEGVLRIAVSDPGRAGRKILREIRKFLSPLSIARVRHSIGFPLRNGVLRHKPINAIVAGHRLKLVPEGAIAADLWASGDYEPAELALICRLLQSDSVFLDVGANVGIFSLVASRVSPEARILAFEPTGKTFDRLSRNIALNGAKNVTPLRFALGNFSGQATLNLNAKGKDGLNTLGKPSHPDSEPTGTETVPITTLDEFIRSSQVGRVDVMKVDAEGAELFIFQGGKNLLQRPDAPVILYEAFITSTKGFDYHPVEIFWLLDQWGFSAFTLDSETGKLATPPASWPYGSMIVAVKASHPAYPTLRDLAR
jgi:FkbM family methyltransferase